MALICSILIFAFSIKYLWVLEFILSFIQEECKILIIINQSINQLKSGDLISTLIKILRRLWESYSSKRQGVKIAADRRNGLCQRPFPHAGVSET